MSVEPRTRLRLSNYVLAAAAITNVASLTYLVHTTGGLNSPFMGLAFAVLVSGQLVSTGPGSWLMLFLLGSASLAIIGIWTERTISTGALYFVTASTYFIGSLVNFFGRWRLEIAEHKLRTSAAQRSFNVGTDASPNGSDAEATTSPARQKVRLGRKLGLIFLVLLFLSIATPVIVSTKESQAPRVFAGYPRALGDGKPAASASLLEPRDIDADGKGGFYFVDTGHNAVRHVSHDGIIRTIAGGGMPASGPGGAPPLYLDHPRSVDYHFGVVYVTDSGNDRVIRVKDGRYEVILGTGERGNGLSGELALETDLDFPIGVAANDSGAIFVSDYGNGVVRKVTGRSPQSTIVAGGGPLRVGPKFIGAHQAKIFPNDLLAFPDGRVVMDDEGSNTLLELLPNGTIHRIAGGGTGDEIGAKGVAASSIGIQPRRIADAGDEGIVWTDDAHRGVLKLLKGRIYELSRDWPAEENGITYDAYFHRLLVGEQPTFGTHRIRVLKDDGSLMDVAGSAGPKECVQKPTRATEARLSGPTDAVADGKGNVYIAEFRGQCIEKIDKNGMISTHARLPGPPTGLASLPNGRLLAAVPDLNVVVEIAADGSVEDEYFAGSGEPGMSGDEGPAADAQLRAPWDVAYGSGRVIISDTGNSTIRMVDSEGIISTIAGTGKPGYEGEGGKATDSPLNTPIEVAIDELGVVTFVDFFNDRIRRIDSEGRIGKILGGGDRDLGNELGSALEAKVSGISGLAVLSPDVIVTSVNGYRTEVLLIEGEHVRSIAGGARGSSIQQDGKVQIAQVGAVCPFGNDLLVTDYRSGVVLRMPLDS